MQRSISSSTSDVLPRPGQGAARTLPSRALVLALVGCLIGLPVHAQVPPAPPPATPAAVAPAPSGKQRVLILHTESAAVADPARLAISKEVYAQAMRYRQLDVVPSNADLVEEMFEFECTEAGVECLARIGAKYGAQLVVFSEVGKAPSGGLQLNMRVVDVQAARMAQATAQPLDLDKPQPSISRGLVVLLGPVEMAAAEAPGVLRITLFAGGVALVYVDDQLMGNTADAQGITVAAGTHTVRVVRAGFREWTARVTVPAGGRAERTVQLEQLASVPGGPVGPVAKPITHKWWFWTAIGVAILGGTAIAVVASSGTNAAPTGAASFTLDSSNAHLDPIFGPAAGK